MKRTPAPSPADAAGLRRRAEAQLKDKKQAQSGKGAAPLSSDETQRLLQELQIHQIELEMQNEELRRIQGELESSRARYFDLYDLAPVGYFTLNEQGMILEINLAAAGLLGAARGALVRQPLHRFIFAGDKDIYHRHRKLLFETAAPQICELRLVTKDAAPVWVRIDAIAAQDAGGAPVCRATMLDITEHKQAEEALREKHRILFENAGEAIYVAQDGKVVFSNPMTTMIIGYSNEELTSRPFVDFIHNEDRDMVMGRYLRRLKGEDIPRRYSFRVFHKNGGFRWVDLDTILINWEGRLATLNFMADITERKQAEEALHQSDDNYRFLFENAGEGILIAQEDRIKFANPALEKILGYPRDVIISKPFTSFIHPDDRAMIVDRHVRRMSGEPVETGYRFRSIAPDGTQRWLHIISRLTSWNGMPASLSFVMDITDHKRAEDELRASEEKYRLIFEHSPLGILSFDEEGTIIACNDNFVKIIGSSREKLVGLNMLKLPDEKMVSAVRNALQGSPGIYEGDYSSVTAKKTTPIRCLFAPMDLGVGRIPGGVGIIEDITERKQAEEALRESEKRFRVVQEISPDGFTILHPLRNEKGEIVDFTWIYENQTIARINGTDPQEVIGKRLLDLFPTHNETSVFEAYIHVANTGNPQIIEEVYVGEIVSRPTWLRLVVVSMGEDIAINAQDITERKHVEESLRQAEENYRSIFENAQEGIYRTTPEGKFLMANQAMAHILGYDSPEELMGDMADITKRLYVNAGERENAIERIERKGFVKDDELQFYRKDGRRIWVSRTMQAVRDEWGKLLCLEGLVTDITDRKNSVDQLRKALGGTIQAIASVVETKDPYTAGHQRRVADLARTIAREMGLSQEQIEGLRVAGIIHDIGKVSVPAEILSSPRKLTSLEFSLIKIHVQAGYDILKDIDFPWPIARMVLEHHERINGSGYPNGLTGDQILPESRILAVADVVEAMATHRPYRAALGLNAALEEITQNKGVLYDPEAVDACLRLFRDKGYEIKVA
jgi:PAS domain S-box-containing protein/putative nucleotidyltransferase with HDIG domain